VAKKTLETREIVYAAFFVGVTVVLGFFIIPVYPVPVTGQSMGPMLAGSVLGGKMGALSMIVFDLLVAAGAPILSVGRGGLGILLGPTGGYIVSWPLAAYISGKIVEKSRRKGLGVYIQANIIGGVVIVYLMGALWLAFIQGLDLKTAFVEGALIFLPGDAVKVFAASWVARAFSRIHPLNPKH
jgi:biotin transport system substrate-specific component